MITRLMHTGVATPDLKQAISFYEKLGFKVDKEFHKPDINADVAMVTKGDVTVELFEFHNLDHPWVEFIRNHIAFYSDDLEDDVKALLQQGYKLTIPTNDGMVLRFAYVQDASGTNYEIATTKTS